MRRLKFIMLMLLGVASLATSCKDDVNDEPSMVDGDRFINIAFGVVDTENNDVLETWYNENCVPYAQPIKGQFVSGPSATDVNVLCSTLNSAEGYVLSASIAEASVIARSGNVMLSLSIFDGDAEKIEISCDKNAPGYDTWLYKDEPLQKRTFVLGKENVPFHFMTLVRHDDGTYTLKQN